MTGDCGRKIILDKLLFAGKNYQMKLWGKIYDTRTGKIIYTYVKFNGCKVVFPGNFLIDATNSIKAKVISCMYCDNPAEIVSKPDSGRGGTGIKFYCKACFRLYVK